VAEPRTYLTTIFTGAQPSREPVIAANNWLRPSFIPKLTYGQRWQVETVNSMIKRRLGSVLRASQYQSQCREIILKALTHNVMIVQIAVFYRAAAS